MSTDLDGKGMDLVLVFLVGFFGTGWDGKEREKGYGMVWHGLASNGL